MQTDLYVRKSLELHLFFGRIMKEHSLFLRAGFTPANPDFSEKAVYYMNEFESLLSQAVTLSNGIVSHAALCSGEIVTEFTLNAEKQTECFTGIPIDQTITERTRHIRCSDQNSKRCADRKSLVHRLNQTALRLLDGLIAFKEEILSCVLQCKLFTLNYPLLIEHIIREAKLYRQYVATLEKNGDLTFRSMREVECFWNQIMMEHAMFIRGLLDPSETDLICSADGFAKEFCDLLANCRKAHDKTITLEKTIALRDYKAAGTQGISNCNIRSVILPLLADHVLREANHYIRLLENF